MSCASLKAIGFLPPFGAESAAMGGAGLLIQNPFSAGNHQALMPFIKKPGVAVNFTNRFGVRDINQVNIAAAIPYKNFGYGITISNFGNSFYHQQMLGFSVAHAFHPKFSVGLGANYQSFSISNYGRKGGICAEFSLVTKVNDKIELGFRAFNPNRARVAEYQDERMATAYQLAGSYQLNQEVKTILEIEKLNAFAPNVKMGIDYMPKEQCHLRVGFSSLQPQFTFGIGYQYKKSKLDFASVVHPYLGVSSHLSLSFEINR